MSNVLYISSEAFPLIKTGGLADVAGSLPVALKNLSENVRLLLPAYPQVMQKIGNSRVLASGAHYDLHFSLREAELPNSELKVWLVDCPAAFDRPGNPYLDDNGEPWHDNARRFALFCQVAVDIAVNRISLNWQPDVVHCNDWQSGLVPALLSQYSPRPATVFTIHNLAYQGLFDHHTFVDLGLPQSLWSHDALEFHGQLSFIKGGLTFADRVNAVSPTYATEIMRPEFGYGLEGLLQHRHERLSGILNGIDDTVWNPATDTHISANYDTTTLKKKSKNKSVLQKQLGLPVTDEVPLIGMVSRLVEQKGLDIILQAMGEMSAMPLQVAILGSGSSHYETQLLEWSRNHPDRISVTIGYDEALSHQIEAGCDIFLMPSTFEPCGLNQLYSLRYGTLPVVTNVGGLTDSVIDATTLNIANSSANGFVVAEHSAEALIATLKRALELYGKDLQWQQLQLTAMKGDFSWASSARHYVELYQLALNDRDS